MVKIKAFQGVRPLQQEAAYISCRPYDVLSANEARIEAHKADTALGGRAQSLYHVIIPEINFTAIEDHDKRLYQEAQRQYNLFKTNGWLHRDDTDCYYVYAQTWKGKTQFGLVVAASVEDYEAGRIKKHELTRRDKEEDRKQHVVACNANLGPAFFAYPSNPTLHAIIQQTIQHAPENDFVADNVRHQLWVINDSNICQQITDAFAAINCLYIADGHHRSAAAARVGAERRDANPHHTGNEEYNYFLAVCFSADELTVLDYNRLLLDLNGHTPEDILQLLSQDFLIEPQTNVYQPQQRHDFGLYLCQQWYKLTTKPQHIHEEDPIKSLDVSISSRLILDKLFGITDLRTDKRIEFVGGIRGLDYLQQRVDEGSAKLALALYPVSMKEVMNVADAGEIMPPKATWFEPKLRSGMVVHELD